MTGAPVRVAAGSRFEAILFDFDGVLLESEAAGNRHLAAYLTALGCSTTPEEAMAAFMGLAGKDFVAAVEARLGRALPPSFHTLREAAEAHAIAEGLPAVAGAIAFVAGLPPTLPIAIVSSSSTRWIAAHVAHLGLADRFGGHLYSGREHVACGKPAPDLYLHGAAALGVPIARCAVIEDSPVGVAGAAASGAFVIGLCAGSHCGADHGATLIARGADVIAADFAEVGRALA